MTQPDPVTEPKRALNEAERLAQARKRVRVIREFYGHASVYAMVNGFLLVLNLMTWSGKLWFIWPMMGWGIGLASHAFSVWGPSMWFGQDWEERKIAQIMAREQIRTLSTEKQLVEAQMRMLQAQIEPHFLFNTLANVVSLIDPAPAKARLMLENFISYLRASLAASRSTQGTVAQEAQLLTSYLELLKIRMGDRLSYRIDLAGDVGRQPLAPMLLQPVVENAIKHGLEPKVEGGHVDVRIWREGPRLKAMVEDNGLGFDPHNSGGVGLANLRERLAVLYDNGASVNVLERSPGTAVLLDLPYLTQP
jgi:LytS/YehU family sensor histidine kinase